MEEAGLTGRGGAAFLPTYRKLQAILAAGEPSVVVASGTESEPASAKDRTLLSSCPHLALDGIRLAAGAVRARQAYLYVRNPELRLSLSDAIAEWARRRPSASLSRLVEPPARFLAGEKTALVNRVSGGNALPRFNRPPLSGHGGAPTLVQKRRDPGAHGADRPARPSCSHMRTPATLRVDGAPPTRGYSCPCPMSRQAIATGDEMDLRVGVNPIACAGYGVCAELLPERIQLGEWEYPIINQDPIAAELDRHARHAVAECPALALFVVEDSERG